ncbi:MAG: extracellular solute-binding protein [Acidisphaera sp.]|nr:extracellular solute-binding protein [Acidisphaera sp.]
MRGITRRSFMAAAALGAAGPAMAQDMTENERALYDAARREGKVTWYQGQIQAEPSEAIGRAFSERYPGVTVDVVRSTSQVAFQRLSQDMRAGVAQCDVLSSTDASHFTFLKREGQLLQYRAKNADGLIEAVRHPDPDGYVQITYLGVYLIARNTQKVSEADAPKSWKDLLDPKWKNQLAIGHPGYSGSIGGFCLLMRRMYGWEYFTALERNKPQIGRSSDDPVTLLNAGERSIGIAVSTGTTLLSKSRGNPLALIYPTEGAEGVPSPSGIPSNAPHPNAAKLFLEFAASPAYFRVTRQFFDISLRPEVPPPEGARPLDQTKLISNTPAELEAGVPEVKEAWRDTFGV